MKQGRNRQTKRASAGVNRAPSRSADQPAALEVFDYPDLRPVKFVGVAITVDAASKAMVARMPPHVAYHEHGFGPVLNRLDRGEFVSGPELAAMLAYNRGLPMPPAISTYLEGFLRGDVAAKRGRKGRAPDDDLVRWACEALKGHQARLRARETAQAQRPRSRREQAAREQFGPKGTPYDRTIRIIHRVYLPTWRPQPLSRTSCPRTAGGTHRKTVRIAMTDLS